MSTAPIRDTEARIAFFLRGTPTRLGFVRTSEIGNNGQIVRWDSRDGAKEPSASDLAALTPRQVKSGQLLAEYYRALDPTSMLGCILSEVVGQINRNQVADRAFRRRVIAKYVARQTGEGKDVDYEPNV